MANGREHKARESDRHGDGRVLTAGPEPEQAEGTLLLVHGRAATAESILTLYDEFRLPKLAALAPQAAGGAWYPQSFLAPLGANQPYLDSALGWLERIVAGMIERGVGSERIALLGFSQGACLTLEYVARHPRRYGAVMGLTGGLIGPPATAWNYSGSLADTPVFLGSSDPDPHVPFARVQETAQVLTAMGAKVEARRYEGMGHTVNQDEVEACRRLMEGMMRA
jgi:phospholipase/carboxylesterase